MTQFRAVPAALLWAAAAFAVTVGGCEKRGDRQAAQPQQPSANNTSSTTPNTGSGSSAGGPQSMGGATTQPAAATTADLPPSQGPGGKPLKLAFVTNNTSDFWKIAHAGVRKYEAEGKVQVDVKMPTDGKTPAEQNQILNDLGSQGYDAVAVSVIAPDDQVSVLNDLAGKAKVITFDSDSAKSSRLLYVGTKNYEAGKRLGQEIVRLLPGGGKIAVFVGTFAADNAKQRLQGIEDAVKGKNIEVVERREDQTDREKARSNVENVLNAHNDLAMVVGLWSYNGPAIAAALEGSGKKGKVKAAVFDEEQGTLDGIEAGTIDVTVVQKPFEMGYQSSKWLHELAARPDAAKGKVPADKQVDTGVQVVSKDNVKQFRDELQKLTK